MKRLAFFFCLVFSICFAQKKLGEVGSWRYSKASDSLILRARSIADPAVMKRYAFTPESLLAYNTRASCWTKDESTKISLRYTRKSVPEDKYSQTRAFIYGFPKSISLDVLLPSKEVDIEWSPSYKEFDRAKTIASRYIARHFKIEFAKQLLYKVNRFGRFEGKHKIITLDYFDPKEFPNWEQISGCSGGFPHYFSVTVDLNANKVVHAYASEL